MTASPIRAQGAIAAILTAAPKAVRALWDAVQRGDHAAIGVLDHLPVLIDLDLPRCHDGALDMGQRAPAAKAQQKQGDGGIAQPERAARGPCVTGRDGHRSAPPVGPGTGPRVMSAWFLTISRST